MKLIYLLTVPTFELYMFFSNLDWTMLQLQIQKQSQLPQPDLDGTGNESEDEIDAALTDLQVSLEGSAVSATGDITRTPELHGYIRFFKYAFLLCLCSLLCELIL